MESKLLRPLCQAVALALAAGGAHAATITVTDGGDANGVGTCTLRQAIVSANNDSASGSSCVAGSGADTIVFAPTLANTTISLSDAGQLLINSNVTLSGSGQTIDAQGYSRVLDVYNNSNTVASVTLSDLGLTGGSYGSPGAGLAIGSSGGVGAPTQRPKRNGPSAPTATGPNVTLNRVVISNNASTIRAGGLYIANATVAINQPTVSGNTLNASDNYGAGGIYVTGGSSVTITDSTISGNTASGAYDYLTGGIYVWNSTVTVTNSTISGNTAGGNDAAGGMSLANASGAIYDSTITGNSAATANVVAGGILVGAEETASLTLVNTILAGNTGTQADLGVYRSSNVIAQSNLLGTALSGSFTGNGNVFNDAPALGALANNGGPTLTMKPNPGSPALGAGNAALIPAGVTTDQRGVGFTRVVNGSLDLGSVEAAAGAVAAALTPTPALSTWALGLLGGLLALLGLRKRKRANG